MRERLGTLQKAELVELAKGQGLKGAQAKRKEQLIDWLTEHWEAEVRRKEAAKEAAPAQKMPEQAEGSAEAEKPAEAKEPAEAEKPAKAEKTVRAGEPVQTEKAAQPEKPGKADRSAKAGRSARAEKTARAGKTAPAGKPAQAEKPVQAEKPAKAEQSAAEKAERTQKPKTVKRAEKPASSREQDAGGRRLQPAEQPQQQAASAPRIEQRQQPQQQAAPAPLAEQRQQAAEFRLPDELKSAADQGPQASGILEVLPDGYGFIRSANFLQGDDDIYVSPSQIRRFRMKTGDLVTGIKRIRGANDSNGALLYVNTINGDRPSDIPRRANFEDMTPIFPNERIRLAVPGASTAMRLVDLISPIGKGQRGMIVSPPKAGKTTLLKQIAKVVNDTHPEMDLIILLIDERPEEVTDIKEFIEGPQVEVVYSTFDKEPDQHRRVSEMVIERAKRLVEQHKDVMILLDSITRLARAYNLTVTPSGRTLSGGLDPAALNMPKRFFGAARNMREGGSLTILATALVDTGSRMDDVVYEEFKGTGNMELVLDRKLSERRVFPAIDILKSGTRRDDLLLTREESETLDLIHKATGGPRPEESVERIVDLFAKTRSNEDVIRFAKLNRRL